MTLRIENAIDLHCHFSPDTIGGSLNATHETGVSAITSAQEAKESGHAALVLKSHSFCGCALARNIEQLVPGLRVMGGICTDHPTGGLNVDAVESALALGAKIVWLPTVHSHQDFLNGKPWSRDTGIHVMDEGEKLFPVVHEIFELVRQKDAILATGHTTAREHYAVAKEFARRGKILVTHAGEQNSGPKLTPDQCAELADIGAMIELTALECVPTRIGKTPQQMVAMIRHVGHERCTLSSDYGFNDVLPHPVRGLREFLESLWENGIPEEELQTMVSANPARLLGLEFAS
jgi:hypothetical protein